MSVTDSLRNEEGGRISPGTEECDAGAHAQAYARANAHARALKEERGEEARAQGSIESLRLRAKEQLEMLKGGLG